MSLTDTFEKRNDLTTIITDEIRNMFCADDVEIIPFGVETISNGNACLDNFIKEKASNETWSSMLVKFAPDFIMLKKNKPQELYFLEIKTTVTPLCSSTNIKEIRNRHKNTKLSDMGIIAREAWNAYNNLFPNCIILAGCSYNSKLLMAQFVKNIKCLRCYGGENGSAFNCDVCLMKKHDLFPAERNYNSTGSKTPHTNIDYSTFQECEEFFKTLGIGVNKNVVDKLKQTIMQKGISFSYKTYDFVKDKIKKELQDDGCFWI